MKTNSLTDNIRPIASLVATPTIVGTRQCSGHVTRGAVVGALPVGSVTDECDDVKVEHAHHREKKQHDVH